jgi:hypothetical protein
MSQANGIGFRPYLFVSEIVDAIARREKPIPPLSVHAVALLWSIARHAHNGSGHCKLGKKRACRLSGISGKTQLRRARDELAERGFVSFHPGSGTRASDYWLIYAALEGRHLDGYQGGTPPAEDPHGDQAGTGGGPERDSGGTVEAPRTTALTSAFSAAAHSGGGAHTEEEEVGNDLVPYRTGAHRYGPSCVDCGDDITDCQARNSSMRCDSCYDEWATAAAGERTGATT